MFTPLITHDSDGTALAAPVDAARRNGATYKTRTIDDLRIKDDRLRAAIEGTGHLLFDGGMGTMLQAAGMKAGALPELLNFEEPQVITDIQRQYVEAGCDVITANTFGANAHKLDGAATVADVFAAAVTCAREAGAHYVAGDIGPIGALPEGHYSPAAAQLEPELTLGVEGQRRALQDLAAGHRGPQFGGAQAGSIAVVVFGTKRLHHLSFLFLCFLG